MPHLSLELWKAVESRVSKLRSQSPTLDEHQSPDLTDYPFYQLPHRACERFLKPWEAELAELIQRSSIAPEDVPTFFAMAYYGPSTPPTTEVWLDLQNKVSSWVNQVTCEIDRWQRADLVFCYALGIGRAATQDEASKSQWQRVWAFAAGAFDWFASERETLLKRTLGILRIQDDRTPSTGLSRYCLDILLENNSCPCVEEYLSRHTKRADRDEVTDRHRRQHRLKAWVDLTGWPLPTRVKGEDKPSQPKLNTYFPLLSFCLRALEGEPPKAAKGTGKSAYNMSSIDKGILFQTLDPRPVLFTTLLCKETNQETGKRCSEPVQDFEYCEACRTHLPGFELAGNRMRSTHDQSWHPIDARKCVNCGNYFALSQLVPTPQQTLCLRCRKQSCKPPKKKPGNPVQIWIRNRHQAAGGYISEMSDGWEAATSDPRPKPSGVTSPQSPHRLQQEYAEFRERANDLGIDLPQSFHDLKFESLSLPTELRQALAADPFIRRLAASSEVDS